MRIKLNKKKKAGNVNSDVFKPLDLTSTSKEIVETKISRLISQMDVYNNERDKTENYRVSLIVRPVLTNILSNVTGNDSLSTFNNADMKSTLNPLNAGLNVKDNLNYINSLFHHLKRENGWLGYYKPEGLSINSNFIELHPKKSELSLVDDDEYSNWDFSLYYISSKTKIHEHGGLPVLNYQKINYGGNVIYTTILTGFNHNCVIGDKVLLSGSNGFDGEYVVLDIGLPDNTCRNVFITIDIKGEFTINENTNIKKVVNGFPCEYYGRVLDKAPTLSGRVLNKNSYKILEAGYAKTYFNDTIVNVIFNEDISLDKVRDYRQRLPLSLVSVCFKTLYDKYGERVFTYLKSGWDLEYSGYVNDKVIDVRKINDVDYDYSLNQRLSLDTKGIIYDFCEFDRWNYKETSLNKTMFRFNTLNRQNNVNRIISDDTNQINLGVRREGYIYDPFFEFKLKTESDYIEEGGEFDEIPYSAIEIEPNNYRWRDVYLKSFDETNNTPFLNGMHYLNGDYILLQNRQDPYAKYGLYYGEFPGDKFGENNNLLPTEIVDEGTNDEC